MADFFKLMQQAQQMQTKLQQMQDDLQHRVVNGSAGGGMVTVEADGRGQMKRIKIDPSLVGQTDVEMLEDLIVVAVNDAQKRATIHGVAAHPSSASTAPRASASQSPSTPAATPARSSPAPSRRATAGVVA